MDDLLTFIQNQLSRAHDRLLAYTHDSRGAEYHKRSIFYKLHKHIDSFLATKSEERWFIIPGLRGVGKTTVLAQLYFYLTNKKLRPLFISLNEVKNLYDATLQNALDTYEKILGINFEKLQNPIFLFIDEVQADQNWAQTLTTVYNRSKKIFVICSGSSAVQLQIDADSARRSIEEKLYPMNFTEFEILKNNVQPIPNFKSALKQTLYFSDNANDVLNGLKDIEKDLLSYWSKVDQLDIQEFLAIGTLPFALARSDRAHVYESILKMIDNIIFKDIQELDNFDFNTLGIIKRLLFIIAESDVLSINKLTQILGVNHLTMANVLDVLEKAELLIKVPAFGANIRAVKKPAKYLFMSPAIRSAFLDITGNESTLLVRQGRLLEDIIAGYLHQEFVSSGVGTISYDSSQNGADFILQILNKKQIAIEVGAGKKDFKQAISTMKRIKCNYGIIIHASELSVDNNLNIIKVPLKYFLLS